MFLFRRSSPSRLFVLQQNDSSLPPLHEDTPMDQYLGWREPQRARRLLGNVSVTISEGRLRLFAIVLILVLMAFSARLAQLQIIDGAMYQAQAEENRYTTQMIIPARGTILDRNNEPLAWNEAMFILTMTASELPKSEEDRSALFLKVGDLTGLQRTDLDLLFSKALATPLDEISVLQNIPYEAGIRLATTISGLRGFDLQTKSKRLYHSSIASLSHILGYTGSISAEEYSILKTSQYRLIDEIGKAGVEKSYESLLRGTPGTLISEVNATGDKLAILSQTQAQAAGNMILSIDASFQKFTEQKLIETLSRVNASRGSVVALDPRTGAVRALVSWPAFDSNEFVGGIDAERYTMLLENENQPLFPRAIAGEFPSGSIFKPFVAYAALAEEIVSEHTSFVSTGGVRIGQWFFPDWKGGGHGITDVRKAIAESVNTYFYIVGGGLDEVTGLGVDRISQYAQRFGFGSPTGIDLPGEDDGFLPSKEWKLEEKSERWYVGDTYHYAIGQGDFLTTPIQMAVAISVIANSGFRPIPYLVESMDGPGASQITHQMPTELQELDEIALQIVRQGMRQTVTQGSARSLSGLTDAVAGKTGTAQTPGDRPYHSWFTGFGPYEDPTLTLVVLIEEGGESTEAAVPLAKELFTWWFQND